MIDRPAFRLADEYLEQSLAGETKAERTRTRLLAAAAALLDEMPFAQLRPEDLAQRAGLSRALIYHYFADLATLVTELVETFAKRVLQDYPPMPSAKAAYDYPCIAGQLIWLSSCCLRNVGLFRMIGQASDQLPGVKRVADDLLFRMHELLGEHVDALPGIRFDRRARLFAGFFLGGGFDSLLAQLFQQRNQRLPQPRSVHELFELVQLMAALRYRQVHGTNPAPAAIEAVAASFDPGVFAGCLPVPAAEATRTPSSARMRRMAAKASA